MSQTANTEQLLARAQQMLNEQDDSQPSFVEDAQPTDDEALARFTDEMAQKIKNLETEEELSESLSDSMSLSSSQEFSSPIKADDGNSSQKSLSVNIADLTATSAGTTSDHTVVVYESNLSPRSRKGPQYLSKLPRLSFSVWMYEFLILLFSILQMSPSKTAPPPP